MHVSLNDVSFVMAQKPHDAFYLSEPSCDIVLNRPWHQSSDRCPNRHNSVQMQWLWLCCYFQLETINNLETRSGKYIWQFSSNKSTRLTYINHKTVTYITIVFPFSELFRDDPKIVVTELGTSVYTYRESLVCWDFLSSADLIKNTMGT